MKFRSMEDYANEVKVIIKEYLSNPYKSKALTEFVDRIMWDVTGYGAQNTGGVFEGVICNLLYAIAEESKIPCLYQPQVDVIGKKADFMLGSEAKVYVEIKNLIDHGQTPQSVELLSDHYEKVMINGSKLTVIGNYVWGKPSYNVVMMKKDFLKDWMFIGWYCATEKVNGGIPWSYPQWVNDPYKGKKYWNLRMPEFGEDSYIDKAVTAIFKVAK